MWENKYTKLKSSTPGNYFQDLNFYPKINNSVHKPTQSSLDNFYKQDSEMEDQTDKK